MLYYIHGVDKPDSLDTRMAAREQHLEYIKDFKLFIGGPTLASDHTTMTGSVIIVELENDVELEDFLKNDPYTKAGLFESVTTAPWKRVIYDPKV